MNFSRSPAARKSSALCLLLPLLLGWGAHSPGKALSGEPFTYRGYYFILSRNPGYGLKDYELILDRMAEDRANMLILWIGGGFPSKRYPETWDYNKAHRNCRENFAGAVIDHAHGRGIKVLLGLTPFAYDGVNRYGAARPELGAVDAQGKPAVTGGIHSLGRGLCPSKPAAQEFMLGYCDELFVEFYPNADGLFLEHSDYGTCQCPQCAGEKGLKNEWRFVEAISSRVWAKKPEALMMIYPQYAALGIEYDPRYVVFVAPHNMRGADKVHNPKVLSTGYWNTGCCFKDLCLRAAREGYAGVIPSMENFTYENPHAFDTRWGPEGSAGWDDLLVRVTRLSFREFAARPDLDEKGLQESLKGAFFDESTPGSAVEDLLALHKHLNHWEGWTYRGGVMKVPATPLDPKARQTLENETLPALRSLKAIRERAAALRGKPSSRGEKTLAAMAAIADWVLERWKGKLPEGN